MIRKKLTTGQKFNNQLAHEYGIERTNQWQVLPPAGIDFDFAEIIRGSEDHPIRVKAIGPFMIVIFSYKRKHDPRQIVNISNSIITTDFENSFSLN